ncbi:hypothetical protein ES707_20987 [subsurface metagenome]
MSWQELPLDRIYFNSFTGVPGTTWPIGTPTVPSDDIADVILMCAARNLIDIDVHGTVQLLASMEHYCFHGHCHESIADVLDLNGQDVDDSRFDNCLINGAQGGANLATYMDCILLAVTGFRGMAKRCAIYTPLAVSVGVSDFDHCTSIHGVITVTVGAPTRLSFKKFSGGMILTLQTGGAALVRGISGYLEVDEMTGGTLDIYADAAEIQINANCTGGTINIYGIARVTDNSGATAVHDYTINTTQLHVMDFWSEGLEEVQLGAGAATIDLPDIEVADLPDGATVVRAIVMFKFRMIENEYAGVNKLQDATVPGTSQVIHIRSDTPLAYIDAINFIDDFFTLADGVREGGDVIVGTIDVAGAACVDENDIYELQWLLSRADANFINFNDVQVGLRIWYSV